MQLAAGAGLIAEAPLAAAAPSLTPRRTTRIANIIRQVVVFLTSAASWQPISTYVRCSSLQSKWAIDGVLTGESECDIRADVDVAK
jgi:hypothetical protein